MKNYVSNLAVEQVYKKYPEEFIKFIKKNKLYEKI
jgi:hypothetical protein